MGDILRKSENLHTRLSHPVTLYIIVECSSDILYLCRMYPGTLKCGGEEDIVQYSTLDFPCLNSYLLMMLYKSDKEINIHLDRLYSSHKVENVVQ